MLAAALCGLCKSRCCLVIDTVIQVFFSKGVGDTGKVDHGIAVLQKRFPIEWYGQIGKSGKADIGAFEGRCCS